MVKDIEACRSQLLNQVHFMLRSCFTALHGLLPLMIGLRLLAGSPGQRESHSGGVGHLLAKFRLRRSRLD